MQLPGEFFVQIETTQDPNQSPERKLIPALDIKQIDQQTSMSFSIMLHEECESNDYDAPLDKAVSKRQSLLALNPMKLFSKDKD